MSVRIRTGDGLEGQRVVSVAAAGRQVARLAVLLENALVRLQFIQFTEFNTAATCS